MAEFYRGFTFERDVKDRLTIEGNPVQAPLDDARSYIDSFKAFPENISIRSFLTMSGARGGGFAGSAQADSTSRSVLVHFNLVELPEKPMIGRLADSRA